MKTIFVVKYVTRHGISSTCSCSRAFTDEAAAIAYMENQCAQDDANNTWSRDYEIEEVEFDDTVCY